jgi:hypothetical protein
VLKVNYEINGRGEGFNEMDRAIKMYRALTRVFNNRKKMVYNWMKRIES